MLLLLFAVPAACGEISRSFEPRYFSKNLAADGETDFKGPTEVFDTGQRIEFLRQYADYAGRFFGDPDLDRPIVSECEVARAIEALKPQPLPEIRRRIPLVGCRWTGYAKDRRSRRLERIAEWNRTDGAKVQGGILSFEEDNITVRRTFEAKNWKLWLMWRARFRGADSRLVFSLSGSSGAAAEAGFDGGAAFYRSDNNIIAANACAVGKWHEFKIELGLVESRYNLYVDNALKADFVPLAECGAKAVDALEIISSAGVEIDEIWAVAFAPAEDPGRPYSITTFINETFDTGADVTGWQSPEYDDDNWQTADPPIVHGGERFAGEDLYIRKSVSIGSFERAVLEIETLDPGGEIWVNGGLAAVVDNRHPVKVDVTRLLKKDNENLVTVRVRHFFSEHPLFHAGTDRSIGWFAGRMHLDLTPRTWIDDVFAHAADANNPAGVEIEIGVKNERHIPFKGTLEASFYPWHPTESDAAAATASFKTVVRAWNGKTIKGKIAVLNPLLWTFESPNLYKLSVILRDANGLPLDDYVVTTGIRTVGQHGGTFSINDVPEMLNGAQIFGFRPPLEKIAAWNRCGPLEWLAREILMIKKMNGNLMRVHVHAWRRQTPARNINDPRLAELGDQMGIMFIWPTTAWIREGEVWGIDFEGYPKYIRQVRNHPSIVMWEASNHPTKFKDYDLSESNDYCKKMYDIISGEDTSRLISLTSHMRFLHYGNDAGTVDYLGEPIQPAMAWTAPMVTRGNQDSVTGYGKDWSVLRQWPDAYTKDFLDSPKRAYFNFEHEESTGQPNWNLVKGKPWYRVHSYEWKYDDGSIGRRLSFDEWKISQAWQAFSAYESMRKQRILDYDGFSWCCLHGGPNCVTYAKPLIDYHGRAKLAFYTNRMAFQRVLAGSCDVDVVYGPGDLIKPVVINLGPRLKADLRISVKDLDGRTVERRTFNAVELPAGRTVTPLPPFQPDVEKEGFHAVEYVLW